MEEADALLFNTTDLTFEQQLAVARLKSDERIALALALAKIQWDERLALAKIQSDERREALKILNDPNSTIAAKAEARNILRKKETLMAALVEWLG